ncbi:low molecular weight phosphotyrosine protein phosphatase [Rhodobacteraceae bacterium CCMM004]|nr:low molecular weight phosphotyrosine protein phosphatase [Rhodobacteraceae bacterium CCMM004]
MAVRAILFVCLGNICRSPTAEAVMRARLAAAGRDIAVDSAGTGAWHVGKPPHPPMIAAAAEYDLVPLRARQVVPGDADRFDLILAADRSVLADLGTMLAAGRARVDVLAPYAGGAVQDIPDPYYTGDYAGALALIEAACDGLMARLD